MLSRRDPSRAPAWRRYLRFWRPSPEDDVGDEIAFHLQSSIDELLAQVLSLDAAAEAARRQFGDVNAIRRTLTTLSRRQEQHMARTEWLDTLRQDVAYALRQLRRSPGFTAIAVLTLALGIGATSAIFSVVYSVLLRPLPYANADRVFIFAQRNGTGTMCCLPFGNLATWQREATDFQALGALWGSPAKTLTGRGDPTPISTVRATASYWTVNFIPPVKGRYFTEAEDREGAAPVAVLSHALWQSRFGGDSGIVGQSILLDGRPTTVVGIAPPEYIVTPPAERIWVPMASPAWRLSDFSDHEARVSGLLKPGVTIEHAVAQLTRIDTRLAREHPNSGYDGGVVATPLIDSMVGPVRPLLFALFGAVALVLLIACANIANLLLARAASRRAELAVRGALGATRSRIVRQLLVESALLALGGGALGLAVAYVGVAFLRNAPTRIPRLHLSTLNGPVLLFSLVAALSCAIVFGLIPALRAARVDLQQALREGGRDSGAVGREAMRRALVVAELGIAQLLLIGAGLLIRSSLKLQSVSAGFETGNLLVASISLPQARYSSARWDQTFQQIQTAVAAVPGVQSVARTQVAPLYSNGWDWTVMREGSNGHDEGAFDSNVRYVTPGYFATLGTPLLRGREFERSDGPNGPRVAIVSRGLARRLWGDEDPIGKRISNGSAEKPDWREVVGVVGDMRASGLDQDPPSETYIPSTQAPQPTQLIVVRGRLPVSTLVPAIRRAVASVDPLLALSRISTIEAAITSQTAIRRFSMLLLMALGGTGLVLAVVGVYGVTAYFVTNRTREWGMRIALGASAGSVRWLVVRQGLTMAVIGLGVGTAGSIAATRVMGSLLYDTAATDPMTFIAVGALLGIVAVAASYFPARRATRISPMEALRST